jgi:formylglycine-generating enzyme required for sulfatase activity
MTRRASVAGNVRLPAPAPAVAALLALLVIAVGCGGSAPVEGNLCPPGMQFVPSGVFQYGDKDLPRKPDDDPRRRSERVTKETIGAFCIDRYEFPNSKGGLPETGVTWLEAASKCRSLGRRLCTEYEWEKSCRGPGGLLFPWGNRFDMMTCALDAKAFAKHRSGALGGCVSAYGVYDMVGSTQEWTANAWDGSASARVIRGGWDEALADKGARCSRRSSRPGSAAEPRTGFRCCAEARVSGLPHPRLAP